MAEERAQGAPDWDEIRDAYEHSADSMTEIARRHGVSQAAIARRVHTHHWYRINDRGAGGAKLNDALIDMAMDVKQAVRSLMTRGRRLMARALKEAGGLKAEMEAHREQIETFDRLVRMTERLSAMLERAGKNAGGQGGHALRDRAPELKRRLAKLAAARRAGGDHPPAGEAEGRRPDAELVVLGA